MNYILNGVLYGIGKTYIPAIALIAGSVIKLGLNIWLVNIPSINIYGAVISTIIYNTLIFLIELSVVSKCITLKVDMIKCFVKPIVSSAVMGVAVFFVYRLLASMLSNTLATIISIITGALIYGILVILTKNLNGEDLASLPLGGKLCRLLEKLRLI